MELFPPPPLNLTFVADPLEFFFEKAYTRPDRTAVGFDLGFAGPLRSDASVLLRQVGPLARQAGEKIQKLRELNLCHRLLGLCPRGEDVQDDPGAVDNFAFDAFF